MCINRQIHEHAAGFRRMAAANKWYRICLSLDQHMSGAVRGIAERLLRPLDPPNRSRGVTVWASGLTTGDGDREVQYIYFSPAASRLFAPLLLEYHADACPRPSRKQIEMLMLGSRNALRHLR